EPFTPFLAALRRVFFVSPTAVKEHEVDGDWAQGWLTEHSAGTGPYTANSWVRRTNLQMVKNPLYWQGWSGKHFDTVNMRVIYEPEAQRLLLERGDLDIITIVN